MELTTLRLRLVPYNEQAVAAAVLNQVDAAKMIGAAIAVPTYREHRFMSKIYKFKLDIMRREPDSWLLSTYWQMIPFGEPAVIIGAAGFKGPPVGGEIEIGYGIQEPYRNLGYVTETVKELCSFAFTQNRYQVSRIFAATERSNIASQRVLKKCGFEFEAQRNGLLTWTCSRKESGMPYSQVSY